MSIDLKDHEFDQVLTDLYSSKKYDDCFEASKEKLVHKPLALQPLLYMATISLERRDLDDCIHYCDTIIRGVDERFYLAWMWRGQAQCLQKKYDEAEDSFEQAIKYNPSNRDTWAYLALNFFMQGKKDVAMTLLDQVEDKMDELKGQFAIVRGYLERADGNKDEAVFQFMQGGMAVDPTSKDYEVDKELYATEIRKTLKPDS